MAIGRKASRKPAHRAGGLGDAVATVAAAAVLGTAAVRAARSGRADSPRTLRVVDPTRTEPATASGARAVLERLGRRVPPFGVALRVQERYRDLHGNNLAAAVTFQAFVSLLPLLLVAVSVVGFVAGGGTDIAGRVIGELGLTGDAARAVTDAIEAAESSKRVAGPVGLAGLLWSGLGLVNALQYAYNQVWQVEARGVKDKAVGVLWLAGAALVFVFAAALTTALRWLPGFLAPLGVVLALGVNLVLWLWTSKVLPNTRLPWRAVLPGSLLAAVGFEALKAIGAIYVPNAVASSSQLYGALGIVVATLAWLYFFGRLIVYSATLNVVLWERDVGTVPVVTEVPRQPGASAGEEVSRMGRLQAS